MLFFDGFVMLYYVIHSDFSLLCPLSCLVTNYNHKHLFIIKLPVSIQPPQQNLRFTNFRGGLIDTLLREPLVSETLALLTSLCIWICLLNGRNHLIVSPILESSF